jgi:hypothetical protein
MVEWYCQEGVVGHGARMAGRVSKEGPTQGRGRRGIHREREKNRGSTILILLLRNIFLPLTAGGKEAGRDGVTLFSLR